MTSAQTLFISDLHLSADTPARRQLFSHFCQHIAIHAQALYILGDFFDVWYSDRQRAPWLHQLESQLRSLTQRSIPVWLMVGNRDFMLGQDFAQRTGCQLLPDPSIIAIEPHRIYLCHGDTLCTEDHHYQRYRAIIRHPITQQIVRCLPVRLLKTIAITIRRISQSKKTRPIRTIPTINSSLVKQHCHDHQCQYLLHGHTHQAGIHQSPHYTRMVLNEWVDHGHYLAWSASGDYTFYQFDHKQTAVNQRVIMSPATIKPDLIHTA